MCEWVCVWVCVCEGEREKDREYEAFGEEEEGAGKVTEPRSGVRNGDRSSSRILGPPQVTERERERKIPRSSWLMGPSGGRTRHLFAAHPSPDRQRGGGGQREGESSSGSHQMCASA